MSALASSRGDRSAVPFLSSRDLHTLSRCLHVIAIRIGASERIGQSGFTGFEIIRWRGAPPAPGPRVFRAAVAPPPKAERSSAGGRENILGCFGYDRRATDSETIAVTIAAVFASCPW